MRWVLQDPDYGRAPTVCSDEHGNPVVVWISWDRERESLKFSRYTGDAWTEPQTVGSTSRIITAVNITSWPGGILIAWIDADNRETDGLKLQVIGFDGSQGRCQLVVPGRRIPAHPIVHADSKHGIDLFWTVRTAGGRALEGCYGASPDALGEAVDYSTGHALNVWPAFTRSEDGAWLVWQAMLRRSSNVMAIALDEKRAPKHTVHVVSHRHGINALPSVSAAGAGGAWIAWQSDYDEEGFPGLVRWVDLAHLSSEGVVSIPSSSMPHMARDGDGEDQGFEAPALTALDSGAVLVIGRGSQSLRGQDLSEQGWSDLKQIDEPGWSCRGSRSHVALGTMGVWVVGREQDGIVARLVPTGDLPSGKPQMIKRPVQNQSIGRVSDLVSQHVEQIADQNVIFGDIHQHTRYSDGTGTPEEVYQRARYRYGDQLASIADHESFLGKKTPPGQWRELCRMADEAYEPGAFITLNAFEWTGAMHPGPGHKVVYLPPGGGELLSRDNPASAESQALVSSAARLGALVFPHHVGWTGADMEHHDPEVQTCWEIVSCHGAYERQGIGEIGTRGDDKEGQFIGDALDSGLRFGFVGGSDGHGLNWHHGVSRVKDSHRTGLTAVFCEELTREGVLDALARRRCYATSGSKIRLWFEAEGRPMGEELLTADPVVFRIVVAAPSPIASLAIVTNGGDETPFEVSGYETELSGTLPPPTGDDSVYYYVRVVLKNGETAWSSPIWLDSPSSA